MAKMKKNKKDSSGELFGRLGRGNAPKPEKKEVDDNTFLADEEYKEPNSEKNNDYDSIDVSETVAGDESDSDLDINELLRKYMPEYSGDDSSDNSSGVLSKLKGTRVSSADDKLISALDSAFSKTASPIDGTQKKLLDNRSDEDDENFISEFEFGDEPSSDHEMNPGDIAEPAEESSRELPDSDAALEPAAEPELELESELEPEQSLADEFEFSDDVITEEDIIREEDFSEDSGKRRKKLFGFGAKQKQKKNKREKSSVYTPEAETPLETASEAAAQDDFEQTVAEEFVEGSETDSFTLDMADSVPQQSDENSDSEAETDGVKFDLEEDELDEPVDSTDMNLMIAFGLDGKGDKKADKAKQLGDRLEATQTSRETKKHKLDRAEFVDKTQIPKIRKEFKRHKIGLWIKLVLCAIFTIALMIFENVAVLSRLFGGTTKQFGGALDPSVYPVVYIMVSLQLMLLACLCAADQIIDGFKHLFRGVPKAESMTSILTVVGILYSIVLSRFASPGTEPVMFNFVVALFALFTIIYAIYNNKREMMNFRIIANKKPKHIIRRLLDEESEGEARAFEDTEDACDVMKIEKTDFIDGFFGRLSKPDPTTNRFMGAILSAAAAIAVLFGIFVNFRGGNANEVLGAVYAAMLILAPLSIYVTFSYPLYRANVVAKEYDSAIIGETSLAEYSNASIISFDDKNVFPSYSVKVQNIRIYNNARIDRVLYYAASVFAYAGGPLQDVFEVATVEMGHSGDVKIFDTEAGFLATQVDGVNIIFGSCEVLRKRGLEIPDSAAEDDVDLSDELSIMYMFRESKLVAKMYVKYVMDADIDLILKQFSGSGLYVCVRTFDPNIDERMIASKINMKRMPLKIVRYANAEEVTFYEEKVDSGLVTCGSPKSLLQIISYCEKVLRTKKTNIALSVLSVMIGTAILVLLLLSGSMGIVNSLNIAIYQIIWVIPLVLSSRMFIR